MAVEMLATWWVRQEGLRRGAAFAVLGEVGGALEAGLSGEDAEHGHVKTAPSAPVDSAFETVCVSAR